MVRTSIITVSNNIQTYNLTEVSGNNNYFANGILVHNKYNPEPVFILIPINND